MTQTSSAHLLKQLQAICVVIISKVDNSGLAAVDVERLSQPSQCKVPLHGAPGDPRVSCVTPKLIVPGRLYIEMGVVQPGFAQKPRDERCSPLWVLHQDPVQVGNMQESVCQSRQFCLLHWPTVCGGDNVDGGQHIRPGRRPRIHVLCPHHLHNVLIWGTVFLGVLYVASCLPSALSSINCRWGDKKTWNALVQPWAAPCICASGDVDVPESRWCRTASFSGMIKISFTRWWQAGKSESSHCERRSQRMDRKTP